MKSVGLPFKGHGLQGKNANSELRMSAGFPYKGPYLPADCRQAGVAGPNYARRTMNERRKKPKIYQNKSQFLNNYYKALDYYF
jgi:hypothetical protein